MLCVEDGNKCTFVHVQAYGSWYPTLGLQKCVHKLITHLEMSMDVSSQGETLNFQGCG